MYYWVLATPVVSLLFGGYLYMATNWFHIHWNEGFSSLKIPDYKSFLRFRITADGDLEMFCIGLRRVPRSWIPNPKWSFRSFVDRAGGGVSAAREAQQSWTPQPSEGSTGADHRGANAGFPGEGGDAAGDGRSGVNDRGVSGGEDQEAGLRKRALKKTTATTATPTRKDVGSSPASDAQGKAAARVQHVGSSGGSGDRSASGSWLPKISLPSVRSSLGLSGSAGSGGAASGGGRGGGGGARSPTKAAGGLSSHAHGSGGGGGSVGGKKPQSPGLGSPLRPLACDVTNPSRWVASPGTVCPLEIIDHVVFKR